MPGRIVGTILKVAGQPPVVGSPEWGALVKIILENAKSKHTLCCEGGGRRKDGWPCESPYLRHNGRCKMHGGNLPAGPLHHNYTHGRTSRMYKSLPARFREAYVASIEDDDLLSLRADISLTDTRIDELIQRLDTGESGQRWRQLGLMAQQLLAECRKNEPSVDKLRSRSIEIAEISGKALATDRAWRELKGAKEQRRKLVDTERSRLKDLHAYLTAEEALSIVSRLVDSVVRHVDDKAALAAILNDVENLTGNTHKQRRLSTV